jgi:hypothetical protein
MGEAGKVGPDLSSIGVLASQRVPGETASDYLRTSIIDPEAYIAPDCPNGPCLEGIMPGDYDRRLTVEQIDKLVDFLLEQETTSTQVGETGADQAPPDGVSLAPVAVILVVSLVFIMMLILWLLKMRSERDESQSP